MYYSNAISGATSTFSAKILLLIFYYFRLRQFLGRALRLGNDRGRAPRLGQARGTGAAATLSIISVCYICTKLIGGGGPKNRSLSNYLVDIGWIQK